MDELLIRQLPHSLEAEQAALGSMLIAPRCIPDVIEMLHPEDFYLRQNREIFETIYSMFSYSQTIDPVTVLEQMRVQGVYDENTSRSYLLQLMEITPTAANVKEYAKIIRDKSLLRSLAEASADISEMVREGTGDAHDIMEAAERKIYAIRQGRSDQGLIHVSTLILDLYARLAELSKQGAGLPGLSTGFPDLDTCISGLCKSELILIAARPGMGKTSFALNMALHAGKHSGKTVVFFSLEMSREQLIMRLISNESFVDGKKLLTGRLSEDDWTKIAAASRRAEPYGHQDGRQRHADRCGYERQMPPGGKSRPCGDRLPSAHAKFRQPEREQGKPAAGGFRNIPLAENHGKGAQRPRPLPFPALPGKRSAPE
jgi:replicative DNA helicase